MKQTKQFKRTALLLSAKSMVSLMLLLIAMLMPQGVWATDFISEIKVSVENGNSGSNAKSRLRNDGYTLVEADLNGGAGSSTDYVYIGYKTTTNAADAITGLLIVESATGFDAHAFANITNANVIYNGKNYYRCDNYKVNDDGRLDCDLNRHNSKGADIVLYYTKDGNTSNGGTPLTSITVVGNTTETGVTYTRHWKYGEAQNGTNNTDVYGNTNQGNGTAHYITYTTHTHSYNNSATFNWASDGKTCTADIDCTCGDKHTGIACTVTSAVKTPATCSVKGWTTYTAKVTYNGKNFSATKDVQDIALIAHVFGADGVCTRNSGHFQEPTLSGDYYQIANYGNLCWFRDKVNGGSRSVNAKQTTDIIMPDGVTWNGIGGGTTGAAYKGVYDGNGHTISNLKMDYDKTRINTGLFNSIRSATVKNLGLINVSSSGTDDYSRPAGLVQYTYVSSTISNCYVTGSVEYPLCYESRENSTIINCFAKVTNGRSLVGANYSSVVKNCFTNLSSIKYLGDSGTEEDCRAGVSDATFASGEITYLLNSGKTDGTQVWYQKLGNGGNALPTLVKNTSNTVYKLEHLKCDGVTKNGSVTYSNSSQPNVDAHNWTNTTTYSLSAADCTHDAVYYKACSVCNVKGSETWTATGTALDHIMTEHAAHDATCTEAGNLLYYTCSQPCCSNKYYKDNAEHTTNTYANHTYFSGSALGHSYDADGVCTHDASHYQPATLTSSYYQITNYGNLCWFRNEANSGKTINAKLTADINLSGKSWATSIGEGKEFAGIFDGQGHTITGNTRKALFCVLKAGSTVKNVVSTGATSKDNYENAAYQSPFVRRNYGTIENCIVKSAYWDSRSSYLGGITGVNETGGIVRNCGFYDSTLRLRNSANTQVGGIVGVNCANGRIENCFTWGINYYNIGSLGSGGIVCENRSDAIVSNCYTNVATPVFKQEGTATNLTSGITAAFITTGEMCYKLNAGTTNGSQVWYQKIGTETFPTPMVKNVSNTVYQGEVNNGNFYVNENGTLASIAINDGAPFASPVDFTANSVTYTRPDIKNQWGTIVVPFDVESGDDYDLYILSSVSGDELTLTKVNGTLTAGTPALIRINSELVNGKTYDLTLTAASNAVNAQGTLTGTPADGLTLTGSYEVKDITGENGYIISNNKFWSIQDVKGSNNVYCAPFRAYIAIPASQANARMLNINVEDGKPTDIDVLNAIIEGEAEYYDMNGRKINSLQTGVNIVKYSNGKTKKVVIK